MEAGFLGVPGIDFWIFLGLTVASFCTHFFGMVTGAAGGLMLLAIMTTVYPPVVVVPLHTIVQLSSNIGRIIIMWSYVVRQFLLPFLVGSVIGAALGAKIFVSLPNGLLQGIIGTFIILSIWLPKLAQMGGATRRFAVVGFIATFLGVFVSATGTLVSPFLHHATTDRRNYVATFGALMVIMHTTKLLAFMTVGIALHAYAPLIIAQIAAGIFATWVGRFALDHVPEKFFRMVFRIILTLLAIRLLYVAARAAGLF